MVVIIITTITISRITISIARVNQVRRFMAELPTPPPRDIHADNLRVSRHPKGGLVVS